MISKTCVFPLLYLLTSLSFSTKTFGSWHTSQTHHWYLARFIWFYFWNWPLHPQRYICFYDTISTMLPNDQQIKSPMILLRPWFPFHTRVRHTLLVFFVSLQVLCSLLNIYYKTMFMICCVITNNSGSQGLRHYRELREGDCWPTAARRSPPWHGSLRGHVH